MFVCQDCPWTSSKFSKDEDVQIDVAVNHEEDYDHYTLWSV